MNTEQAGERGKKVKPDRGPVYRSSKYACVGSRTHVSLTLCQAPNQAAAAVRAAVEGIKGDKPSA